MVRLSARFFLPVAFYAFFALAAVPGARADEQSDSLAYEAKRRQVLERGADERQGTVLAAAQDLARDGYFAEALDLIFSMQDTSGADWEDEFDIALEEAAREAAQAAAAGQAAGPVSKPFGYVQSGIDFERWDGLDTSLGGHVRGKLEWDPPGRLLDRVSAVAQGSDRNAYFDFLAKGSAFGRMVKFEGEALTEKVLWRTSGDSLDRLYLNGRVDLTTQPLGLPLAVEAPIVLQTGLYRHDGFGARSYRSVGIAPGVQAMSGNTAKSLLLAWDVRGTQYPGAPSASNFGDGPVASGWWYGDRAALDAETRFTTTRYNRDTSLHRHRRLETMAGGSVRVWRGLRIGVRTTGETDVEDYRNVVDTLFGQRQEEYRLQGSTWGVRPRLAWEWAAYSASLDFAFARGRFPLVSELGGAQLSFPLYLNVPNDDWKAGAGLTMLSKAIFLTLSLEYEVNWVPNAAVYGVGSSKGLGANASLTWKLRPWFEVDGAATATKRLELQTGYSAGRIRDYLLFSLGITSRFP